MRLHRGAARVAALVGCFVVSGMAACGSDTAPVDSADAADGVDATDVADAVDTVETVDQGDAGDTSSDIVLIDADIDADARWSASASAPAYAVVGEEVAFDGSASTGAATYRWDFGDGRTAVGALATTTYDQPGRYSVVLTVEDDTGNTRAAGVVVAVTLPPVFMPAQSSTIARLPQTAAAAAAKVERVAVVSTDFRRAHASVACGG